MINKISVSLVDLFMVICKDMSDKEIVQNSEGCDHANYKTAKCSKGL